MENQKLNELLTGVDTFAEAMKKRILEKAKQNTKGWKETTLQHCRYKMEKLMMEEIDNNPKKDIDIANWALIHFLNRQK